MRARRARIVALLAPLAGAYLLAGALISPFLFSFLAAYPQGSFYAPDSFIGDLANLAVPTRVTAAGGAWLHAVSRRFSGNLGEQGAYLGLPTLLIVVLYARDRLRTAGGRFLLVALAAGIVLMLGGKATVAGTAVVRTPWSLLRSFSFYDNLLTTRFAVYVALAAAVVVALWAAGRRAGVLHWLLPVLAVLAVVPNPHAGGFASTYHVPAYFTARVYRDCLGPSDTVLAFPVRGGSSLLWQVKRGFRFRLAGGDIGPGHPAGVLHPSRDRADHGRLAPRCRRRGRRPRLHRLEGRDRDRGRRARRRSSGRRRSTRSRRRMRSAVWSSTASARRRRGARSDRPLGQCRRR